MAHPLKTTITKDAQRYVDEPVYVNPKVEKGPSILELSVAAAFNGGQVPHARSRKPILVGYERVRLRWVTPDGKGGLKERGRLK